MTHAHAPCVSRSHKVQNPPTLGHARGPAPPAEPPRPARPPRAAPGAVNKNRGTDFLNRLRRPAGRDSWVSRIATNASTLKYWPVRSEALRRSVAGSSNSAPPRSTLPPRRKQTVNGEQQSSAVNRSVILLARNHSSAEQRPLPHHRPTQKGETGVNR
jgi:hypothetical protein